MGSFNVKTRSKYQPRQVSFARSGSINIFLNFNLQNTAFVDKTNCNCPDLMTKNKMCISFDDIFQGNKEISAQSMLK